MRRRALLLSLSVGLVAVARLAAAAPDDSLSTFVGRYSGTIGNRLPGITPGGMPIGAVARYSRVAVTVRAGIFGCCCSARMTAH